MALSRIQSFLTIEGWLCDFWHLIRVSHQSRLIGVFRKGRTQRLKCFELLVENSISADFRRDFGRKIQVGRSGNWPNELPPSRLVL